MFECAMELAIWLSSVAASTAITTSTTTTTVTATTSATTSNDAIQNEFERPSFTSFTFFVHPFPPSNLLSTKNFRPASAGRAGKGGGWAITWGTGRRAPWGTLTLSRSLPHTLPLCLPASFPPSLCHSPPLSLSLFFSLSHSLSLCFSRALSHSHAFFVSACRLSKTASSRSCVRAACCVRLAMLTSTGVWHCCVLLSLSHSLSFSPSRSPSLPPRLLPSLPLPLSPSVSVSLLLSLSLSLPLFLARALSLACLFRFCMSPARRPLAVAAACVLHVVCGWRC